MGGLFEPNKFIVTPILIIKHLKFKSQNYP